MRPFAPSLLVALLCGSSSAPAEILPGPPEMALARARAYWPTQDWQVRTLAQAGVDEAAWQRLLGYLFPEGGPEAEGRRRGVRTDGLVVIKQGTLIFERYARGYDATRRHAGWSMAKSLVSALIGVAERENLLSRKSVVQDLLPSLKGPKFEELLVEHLLRMSSGLQWQESYEQGPLRSSVLAMLYSAGFRDMAGFVAAQPRESTPGRKWRYSSGDTNLLMGVLKGRLSKAEYDDFPFSRVFQPLGMRSAVFEQDQSGTFVGSSYFYATPRDFARFGFWILNQGVWEGQPRLPPDWVFYSTRLAPAYSLTRPRSAEPGENPGASWWLNVGDSQRLGKPGGFDPLKQGAPRPWPAAPEDTFAAMGHWGQSIFVIPSKDLVAVRTADDRDGSFDANEYLRLLLGSLR